MPRGDGTGPEGQGPITGRGAGKCDGNTSSPQDSRRQSRRGTGRGQGSGRGRRLGRWIADGFNNLRQRARGGNARPRGNRGRNNA